MVKFCSRCKSGRKKCIDISERKVSINRKTKDSSSQKIDKSVKKIIPNIRVELIKKPLSKRKKTKITDPSIAAGVVRGMSSKDREEFRAIHLNTRNEVIGTETLSQGILDAAIITPRETFKGAILNNSKSIIVAHNHPSGDPSPSEEDIRVCRRLKSGGKTLDIPVLDCLVIGKNKFVSLNQEVEDL